MNIIPLEPERVNNLQLWWMKPQGAELIACLDKALQKAMLEHSDLAIKGLAEKNANFVEASNIKLAEATELDIAIKVLKSFFPDGPFIARIEL